jgi:tRNA nucleotidyltransferase (CCA-adding enzyme)
VLDTARDAYNATDDVLYPNLPNAEATIAIDVTANGFKIRNNTTNMNNSGSDTYIFAAFAEHPFGGSNVAPSPAR